MAQVPGRRTGRRGGVLLLRGSELAGASWDARAPFAARVAALPRLGLGISTELGAAAEGLDPLALRDARPDLVRFLEVGADLARGVDDVARAWAGAGHPTTYHFLDANLEEGEDLDDAWIAETVALARSLGAAWLCGDAGLWHLGPRDRGHGVLLPPVLTPASARGMAANVRRLREASGFEVLPENPPAHSYLGELHLLDYFARVAEDADAGLLLDVAHLAIHQRVTGRAPLDGLDAFPLERVVEVHVAGATLFDHGGRRFADDDHSPEPLPETWAILDYVLPRAPNLRAVVYECERNPREAVVANFERLARALGAVRPVPSPVSVRTRATAEPFDADDVRRLQRTLVRMQHDPGFAARLRGGDAAALVSTRLSERALAALQALDPAAVEADRDGRRRAQLLRNLAAELRGAAAVGPAGDASESWIDAFPASDLFHAAIARDESLPLAFARHAETVAAHASSELFRALVALDVAMLRARREVAAPRAVAPGEVALSERARVVALPAGTHAASVAIAAGDAATARDAKVDPAQLEHVLLVRDGEPRFGRLPELRVERLEPVVAAFLAAAREPQDAAAIARFAAAHELDPEELAAGIDEFVLDGVLVRASA